MLEAASQTVICFCVRPKCDLTIQAVFPTVPFPFENGMAKDAHAIVRAYGRAPQSERMKMSDQTPEINSVYSPFETFHVPLNDVVTQSIEEMLANNFAPETASVDQEVEASVVEQTETPDVEPIEVPEPVQIVESVTEHVEVPTMEHVDVPVAEQVEASRFDVSEENADQDHAEADAVPELKVYDDEAHQSTDEQLIEEEEHIVVTAARQPELQVAEPVVVADKVAAELAEPITEVSIPEVVPVVVDAPKPAPKPNHVEPVVSEKQAPQQPEPAAVSHQKIVVPEQEQIEPSEEATCFRALKLSENVLTAIESSGYTTPTDIQSEIIPHVLAGRDVLAQSQTGTGKTAAFALPILSKINVSSRKPQVLVLAPTRELAMQVAASFSTYGKHIAGFDVAAVYGGQGYDTQLRQLRRGVPVVVGTPGRVIDHINRRTMDLSELECLVLDEADEMLNMGFLEDVKFVLEQTPKTRQVALFSATLPGPIQKIAQQYLNDPVRITIKRKTMTADAIRQRAVIAGPREKLDVLTRFLGVEETDGVIIFTKTREATVTVAEHLVREGFAAVALNGDMPQNVRERTIAHLKSGRLDVLVATDVAARGLDVSRVSHVFNFDVPQDSESYVHRIGRTGRAGRKGEAIILLSNSQRYKLKQIERLTKQSIEVVNAPTADDINASRIEQFKKKITEVADSKSLELFTKILTEYATESGKSMEVIAAALAEITQNGRPFLVQDRPGRNRPDSRGDRFERDNRDGGDRFNNDRRDRDERPRQPRRSGRVEAGMDRYRIEVGREDGVMPGNIVGAVANEAGIEGEFIGPINIYDNYSTIDLPEGMPREVHDVLQVVRVAGKPLRLRKATESDNHGESGGGGSRGGAAAGRSFSRGPKRFGGKPRSSAPGGRFDRKKRKPRD